MLDENLINEIGEFLGYEMWNKRDTTKTYDFAGARDDNIFTECGDHFMVGYTVNVNYQSLLCFNTFYKFPIDKKAMYTLNLKTLKPTKNSPNQKLLSPELIEKLKKASGDVIDKHKEDNRLREQIIQKRRKEIEEYKQLMLEECD